VKYKTYVLILLAVVMVACQPITEDLISVPELNLSETEQNETQQETQNTTVDESRASYRITVTEGGLARIPVTAFDPDGGQVTIRFEQPFNQDGLWLTKLGDEGRYLIRLQATDGILTTTEYVLVDVLRANRPPVVECPREVNVTETQNITINCNIVDPEGDDFTVRYEGFMNSSLKQTTYGDAGAYTVIVRATDEKGASNSAEVTVNVEKLNRPPVIQFIEDQSVLETETLSLNVVASDPDGDALNITFSEPFNQDGTYTPEFGDRGQYNVTVTVSDGSLQVQESFSLTVMPKNRPPVLEPIAPITVLEGETVRIPINAYDPDGDDLIISYRGFMNSRTYTTTYEDAYPNGCNERLCTATYYTTVTVSDGELEASQTVEINVVDRNRPPVFVFD
jgi:hypothetical protein